MAGVDGLIALFAWQSPRHLIPTIIVVAIMIGALNSIFRRQWDRDRRATRDFVDNLLQ